MVRRLALTLAAMLILLVLFYFWQPYRVDWFPRARPNLDPVDPAATGVFAKGARALLVIAHPDDDAYFVGGTMLKLHDLGADVHVFVMTDGDKGYYPFHDWKREAAVREAEGLRATAMYGASEVDFLHEPDSRMGFSDELVRRIAAEIRSYRPTAVLCFDPAYPPKIQHRDHLTSGAIAVAAAKSIDYKGWMLLFATTAPNCLVDVTAQWPREEELIAVYTSQWKGSRLTRVRDSIRGAAETLAADSRAVYANGFRAVHSVTDQEPSSGSK